MRQTAEQAQFEAEKVEQKRTTAEEVAVQCNSETLEGGRDAAPTTEGVTPNKRREERPRQQRANQGTQDS